MPETKKILVPCRAVVLWIDWYAYHLARFQGLQEAFGTRGEIVGLELVSGEGVHAGMQFREARSPDPAIRTLLPGISWKDASQVTLARLVWHHLDELDAELVLIPGYYTLPALAAALWARFHGRTSVLMTESTAGDFPRSAWKERIKGILLRQLFQWAVCGGLAHLQYLRQLGFPMDHVANYYNVVGNDAIHDGVVRVRENGSAAQLGLPQRFFLFVGRLAPEKNVRGLFAAWLRYRAAGGTWGLVFAGDGPERAFLESAASESSQAGGLKDRRCDVVFAGHRTAAELLPFYSFASALVLPSTREPWGLVVNEAMAAGLPVIVSDRCGCAPTLVEANKNGLVFDPEKEEQLVGCLRRMASLSDSERAVMGRASLDIIADYSPRNFGREVVAIAHKSERRRARVILARKESA